MATRAELVLAARKAFVEQGYASVKLDAVARAAHATTGAIYHHFGGKAGLLLAVGEHVEREVVVAIGARVPRDAAPWDALEAVAMATLEVCSRPEVAAIIFGEAPSVLGADEWREVEMRYGLGALEGLFRRVSADGSLRPDDPRLVTRLFMACLREAVHATIAEAGAEPRKVIASGVSALLLAFRVR